MNTEREMTPDEARRALAEAADAEIATPADRSRLERGLIAIAVAVSLLILALRATIGEPSAPLWVRHWGLGVAMAIYVAVIVAAVVVIRRTKAAPRGFTSRYTVGLALSFMIYAAYIVIQAGTVDTGMAWMWVILFALAAATPSLLAAHSISKLPLR